MVSQGRQMQTLGARIMLLQIGISPNLLRYKERQYTPCNVTLLP